MSRRLRIDRSKDFDPLALRRDEAVANVFLIRMSSHDLEAGRRDRSAKALFHLELGPASTFDLPTAANLR